MSEFDEKMEQLRERFRSRAGEDRARLIIALEQGDRGTVRHLAHGLSGSGGVFGFPEISQAAEELEDKADEGAEAPELRVAAAPLLDALARIVQPE